MTLRYEELRRAFVLTRPAELNEAKSDLTAVRLTAGDSLASDCSAMVYTAIFLAAI
jgi:hypothetical protein